jgi:hypothetical protein
MASLEKTTPRAELKELHKRLMRTGLDFLTMGTSDHPDNK